MKGKTILKMGAQNREHVSDDKQISLLVKNDVSVDYVSFLAHKPEFYFFIGEHGIKVQKHNFFPTFEVVYFVDHNRN